MEAFALDTTEQYLLAATGILFIVQALYYLALSSSSALTKKWKICAATCPLSSSRTIRSSKSSSSMTARRVKAKII